MGIWKLFLLQMSFSASVLILAIIIIRAIAIHNLPKKTFHVLWGIALCRLLIPFSIPLRFNRFNLYNNVSNRLKDTFANIHSPISLQPNAETLPHVPTISIEGSVSAISSSAPADVPGISEGAVTVIGMVGVIWLIGLVICALVILATHLRCRLDYQATLPIENEFVHRWLQEHSLKRTIQIRQSDKIAAPLTYGVWRPVILLPKTMDWTNEAMVRYVLTHELIHIKRFDILYKWLLAATLCIHWFNPLVWVMYLLANRDIEISCDETLVHTFGEINKSSYALMLIELEEKKSSFFPLFAGFSKNAIEERIVAIMKIKKTTMVSLVIAFVLVATSTIVFATSTNEPKDLGMFGKAMTDAYKYAENINKISNETARIETEEYTLYIDSTIFTDHYVYAIIGAEGNLPASLDINGKIVYADHVQDLYGLNGKIKEIESVDGMQYFFYSALITEVRAGQNNATDPTQQTMLTLAAGDSFKRSSLRDYEGENLELKVTLDGKEHILTTAIANVSTNALIFHLDAQAHPGDYYSKLIITPWEVKFSGHSDKIYDSYEELNQQLPIDLMIVLSGGQKINMRYGSKGPSSSDEFPLGMSRGAHIDRGARMAAGDFYHWWNFREWELDLKDVQSIVLNGKTYRVAK